MTINLNLTLIKPFLLAGTVLLSPLLAGQAAADGGGAYSGYDTNRDGYLDRSEFKAFAEPRQKRSVSPDLWEFESMDADGDGKISEQEMVETLMKEVELKQQKP